MTTHDIRRLYLDYFEKQGHAIVPSSSLLPENDPTTLFTGSGMQPMVPYLLGQKHPLGTRLTDSQKCFRSQDVEEVGDNRHTTFFEMLGNWSLGDYFKAEQIPWMYGFLTRELKLDPARLYFTCFRGLTEIGIPRDEESAELWRNLLQTDGVDAGIADFPERDGLQGARIFYYDEKKNWWSRAGVPGAMPIGEPGGPDTEMFWDFGAEGRRHENSAWRELPCHVNCDCGRFMEIGNNVFMQYQRTESGFSALPQKNVDFGGGLERLSAALSDEPDIFKIDLFAPARVKLEELTGQTYGAAAADTRAMRIILDHLRAAVFLIADGAAPGNKDQGYFVRRLLRRSIRYAQKIGRRQSFCPALGEAVIKTYAASYPQLAHEAGRILEELEQEEAKFRRTLDQGMRQFDVLVQGLKNGSSISADAAFDLYQSYGFPLEMTEELAAERSLAVDTKGFDLEMKRHQELSRQGSEHKFKGGLSDHSEMSVKYHTATHLLHATLKKVLGEHVEQRGSNITPERLRFDFSHPAKMTAEQISETEKLINAAISRDYPVSWQEMSVEEARAKQAIGLFAERYDGIVKVYTIGDSGEPAVADPGAPAYSREICGGPHVEHTGVLGHFRIVKEEACCAGIRRIKAVLE